MPFKSVFERNLLCILHKRHRFENWESSNELFDWLKQIVQPIKKRLLWIIFQSVYANMKIMHILIKTEQHKRTKKERWTHALRKGKQFLFH